MITAEQFALGPDAGYPEELIRGRIVPMPLPKPRLGEICSKADRILGGVKPPWPSRWTIR
jgi:hypothetical protein